MTFEWNSNLETGFGRIDAQHRELVDRFNALIASCREARGRDGLPELLDFLDNYVRFHFGEEEALMRAHKYPEMAEHLEQHQLFLADVEKMKHQFHTGGASTALLIEINTALMKWIIDHIKKRDMKLGAFLQEGARQVA